MGNQYWQTPPEIFNWLNNRYGPFTVDGAASHENSLCLKYYSEEDSAFDKRPFGERIFCNPPYADLKPWVELFAKWRDSGSFVLALLPCDPSTKWWARMMEDAVYTRIMGPSRVAFIDPETGQPVKGNKGASVVSIWMPRNTGPSKIEMWNWTKDVFN